MQCNFFKFTIINSLIGKIWKMCLCRLLCWEVRVNNKQNSIKTWDMVQSAGSEENFVVGGSWKACLIHVCLDVSSECLECSFFYV